MRGTDAMRAAPSIACSLVCLIGVLGAAPSWSQSEPASSDEPRAWLKRMNEALTRRNYDGVFMHVRGDEVETLRIIHRVQNSEVRERLVSLDGSRREVIHSGNELICYLPDQRAVVVERGQDGPLIGNLPVFDDRSNESYEIKQLERGRLMGRDTRLVSIEPRDQFRYGYRLWIDEQTAMPLKSQLCDGRGNVIEQIVFSNLVLPARIADSEFVPSLATEGFRWLRQEPRAVAEADLGNSPLWAALRLPPGFKLTSRSSQAMPGSAVPVAHVVFSDGVASVSVFVESTANDNHASERFARIGSTASYSTRVAGTQVTAVGEVPPETVRWIAALVRNELRDNSALARANTGERNRAVTPAATPDPAMTNPASTFTLLPSTSAPAFAPSTPAGPRR